MRVVTAAEIATLTSGYLFGDGQVPVHGVATPETAGPDEAAFVATPGDRKYLPSTRAGVLVMLRGTMEDSRSDVPRIVVEDLELAQLRVLQALVLAGPPAPGCHSTAIVSAGAQVGGDVEIGPFSVIGENAQVGDGCRIGAHVTIGADCSIGPGSVLHPHSTLYPGVVLGSNSEVGPGSTVGSDGFGYGFVEGGHRKISQIGTVVAGPATEVGANTTVDRGSIGDTVVGAGSKLGNLVHIGHNARIGESLLMEPQAGIAGSAVLGDRVSIGGAVAIVGHIHVGDDVHIARLGGVTQDLPSGAVVAGTPAKPVSEVMEAEALTARIPWLVERLAFLERTVGRSRGDDDDAAEGRGEE